MGTERQHNLRNGWQEIAYENDWQTSTLHIGAITIPGTQLMEMSEGQRMSLAYQWVVQYGGYVDLADVREDIAACIEQNGLPGSSGTYGATDAMCTSLIDSLANLPGAFTGVSEADRGVLFGCRLDRRGRWIFPTGPYDPRLAERPILDSAEAAKVQQLHLSLLRQLDAFEEQMDGVANPFVRSDQWQGDSLLDMLYDQYYDPVRRVGTGHTKADAFLSSIVWDAYWGRFESFLRSPQHLDLRLYVGWWLDRRQAIADQVVSNLTQLNPVSQQAIAAQLLRIPWTWELQNELDITEYLDGALTTGIVR
jgi:hypothetical protein